MYTIKGGKKMPSVDWGGGVDDSQGRCLIPVLPFSSSLSTNFLVFAVY